MATQNLWGINNVQRNVSPGWTASSISQGAARYVANQTAQSYVLNSLTNKILGVDNIKMGTSVPAGVPVGTAQNLGSGGIPAAVQSAIGNLQTNIEANNTQSILQKFLEAIGWSKPNIMVNTVTPAMDQYYQNKNTIMAAPASIQTNINTLRTAADKLQPPGIMSITPGVPGAYEGSVSQDIDRQLTQAYAKQSQAVKAAQTSGWLPYMPY